MPGTRDSADTQVRTTWGPGATDVATILARHSANSMLALARFVEANVLNWFIAAPDAHANAMGIGGERRVAAITDSHWRAVARAVGLLPRALVDRIAELGEQVPAAIDRVIERHDKDTAGRGIVSDLMDSIGAHVARCLIQL